MTTKHLYSLFLCLAFSPYLMAQKVVQLYENKPKGSENWTWSEQISTQQSMINSMAKTTWRRVVFKNLSA